MSASQKAFSRGSSLLSALLLFAFAGSGVAIVQSTNPLTSDLNQMATGLLAVESSSANTPSVTGGSVIESFGTGKAMCGYIEKDVGYACEQVGSPEEVKLFQQSCQQGFRYRITIDKDRVRVTPETLHPELLASCQLPTPAPRCQTSSSAVPSVSRVPGKIVGCVNVEIDGLKKGCSEELFCNVGTTLETAFASTRSSATQDLAAKLTPQQLPEAVEQMGSFPGGDELNKAFLPAVEEKTTQTITANQNEIARTEQLIDQCARTGACSERDVISYSNQKTALEKENAGLSKLATEATKLSGNAPVQAPAPPLPAETKPAIGGIASQNPPATLNTFGRHPDTEKPTESTVAGQTTTQQSTQYLTTANGKQQAIPSSGEVVEKHDWGCLRPTTDCGVALNRSVTSGWYNSENRPLEFSQNEKGEWEYRRDNLLLGDTVGVVDSNLIPEGASSVSMTKLENGDMQVIVKGGPQEGIYSIEKPDTSVTPARILAGLSENELQTDNPSWRKRVADTVSTFYGDEVFLGVPGQQPRAQASLAQSELDSPSVDIDTFNDIPKERPTLEVPPPPPEPPPAFPTQKTVIAEGSPIKAGTLPWSAQTKVDTASERLYPEFGYDYPTFDEPVTQTPANPSAFINSPEAQPSSRQIPINSAQDIVVDTKPNTSATIGGTPLNPSDETYQTIPEFIKLKELSDAKASVPTQLSALGNYPARKAVVQKYFSDPKYGLQNYSGTEEQNNLLAKLVAENYGYATAAPPPINTSNFSEDELERIRVVASSYSGDSIVEFCKSIPGFSSCSASGADRLKLVELVGVVNYTPNANKNLEVINELRSRFGN